MKNIQGILLLTSASAVLSACGGGGSAPLGGLVQAPATAPAHAPPLAASDPDQACKDVAAKFKLADTTIDAATYVAAGFTPPGSNTAVTQPFCRVQVTSKPSADSDIKSELWMPALAAWNGRFLAVGGGGNSGSIQYPDMTTGLSKGFAVLSTDNGHQGQDQSFAIGHPEKVIDFGNRAQAVTAVAGKAITTFFYQPEAMKSYWLGCSQGGGKGMIESQRYPENFDGIVAARRSSTGWAASSPPPGSLSRACEMRRCWCRRPSWRRSIRRCSRRVTETMAWWTA